MYHYVRDDSILFPFSRHKEINEFVKEINFLKKEHTFLSIEDLDLENVSLEKSYILTFDDGIKDHLKVAEILKSKNINASFYIPIKPLLNNEILPVHKTHIICSHLGGESLNLLKNACIELGIDIEHLISNYEKLKYGKIYSKQEDENSIKEFKRIINYYGDINLRDKLLNNILKKIGLNSLKAEDFYLTKNEIKYISSLGFEIGSHSVSHTLLSRLKYKEQKYELNYSKVFLENIVNKKVNSFCFPFEEKSYNSSTLGILRELNYSYAISVESRDIAPEDLKSSTFELPRYDCNEISKLHPDFNGG